MSPQKKIFSNDGRPLLSARKAAARLKCAQDYVSKLCREGKLVGQLLEGQWYVDPASIAVFEQARMFAKQERAESLGQQRRNETLAYQKQHGTFVQKSVLAFHTATIGAPIGLAAGAILLVGSLVFASTLGHSPAAGEALTAAVSQSETPFFGTTPPAVVLPHTGNAFAGASNFLSGMFATLFGKSGSTVADAGAPQSVVHSVDPRTEQIPSRESAYPESASSAVSSAQATYPSVSSQTLATPSQNNSASAASTPIAYVVSGVTEDELTTRLADLQNKFAVQISNLENPGRESPLENFALPELINNLSNVRLNGDTVADNIAVQYLQTSVLGVTGTTNLSDTNISGVLNTATTTTANLTVNGNATTTGIAYFNSDVNVDGNTTIAGNLTVENNNGTPGTAFAGTTTVSNLIVQNTSTSTFAGTLAAASIFSQGAGYFSADLTSLGTTTLNKLTVLGDTTLANATSTNFFSTLASTTNLFAQTASVGTFTATSSTLGALVVTGNLTAQAGTTLANATSSAFFATTASSTNLFAQTASFGSFTAASTTLLSLNISGNSTTTGNAYFAGGLGVGIATSAPGVLQTSSNAYIGGNLFVAGNSTTLGNSSSNTLTINSSINSSIVPDQNIQYDLGSPSFFWRNVYVGTINANNIVASNTQIGGTQSSDFTINSDNVSADAEDANLIFFRGNVVPNAVLGWNSSTKNFSFNQPVFIQNASNNTGNVVTLDLKGLAGQTADLLRIASSTGASYLEVGSGGRIGIGTSTPASSLDIFATDALHLPVGTSAQRPAEDLTGQIRYNTTTHQFEGFGDNSVWQGLGGVINAAQTTYITATDGNFLNFFTNSLQRMTIADNGNVGIGTTSPSTTLAVEGNQYTSGSAFFGGAITATSTLTLSSLGLPAGSFIAVDASGKLIATSSPALIGTPGQVAYFSGTNTAMGTSSLFINTNGSINVGGSITPASDNTSLLGSSTSRFLSGNFGPAGINIWNVGSPSTYEDGNLSFISNILKLTTTAPLGGNFHDIQIAPGNSSGLYVSASGPVGLGYTTLNTNLGNSFLLSGRIGIGTSTPGGPLVVLGNGRATGDLRYGLQIDNTDLNSFATAIAFAGGGNTAAALGNWFAGTDVLQNGGNNFFIATSTGPLTYPSFVVTSTGSVGIGTSTPSATLAVNGPLYVANSGAASSTFTGNVDIKGQLHVGTNSIYLIDNATSTFSAGIQASAINVTTGCVSVQGQCLGSLSGTQGQVAYLSGTNKALGTSTLFISPNGNVGVGTTTAVTTLDVAGNIRVGNSSATCTTAQLGIFRFNQATSNFEGCTNTGGTTTWAPINNPTIIPATFTFASTTQAQLSAATSSAIDTLTNFDGAVPVRIIGDGDPQFSINGSAWETAGYISSGQTLQLRTTTFATNLATSTVTVWAGDGSATWQVGTGLGTPNPLSFSNSAVTGQQAYTAPGTYSWTAPAGVTSVSVVAVGGGGGGSQTWANPAGSGGGLGYKNNITVVPGQTYTVVVGAGGTTASVGGIGGSSYFNSTATVEGCGGGNAGTGTTGCANNNSSGGGYVGDGGGAGGNAPNYQSGGGAGGYAGNGGNGAGVGSGFNGSGGGGGGGYYYSSTYGTSAGGGVGILGQGTSGVAGTSGAGLEGGRGGSGGANGADGEPNSNQSTNGTITGGAYGGGGGGPGTTVGGGAGGSGAVRIIWGSGRSFPSTLTTDQTAGSLVQLSSVATSTTQQITGINIPVAISVSGSGSPQYQVCSDSACASVVQNWTSSPGTVLNNQYVRVSMTSSSIYSVTLTSTLTVGPTIATFSLTTIPAPGQQAYTAPGTYSWTAPAGVTSISVVAVGGGGGGSSSWSNHGGAGGGLGYKNNITVVPGQTYTVVVGAGGTYSTSPTNGNNSYFVSTATVAGYGAGQGGSGSTASTVNSGGGFTGDGGGRGGNTSTTYDAGGAGGYAGHGADGNSVAAQTGSGGGGGPCSYSSTYGSGGGGGVGILGQGSDGVSGCTLGTGGGGGGGSGGQNGAFGEPSSSQSANGTIYGGAYGGGGGGGGTSFGGGNGGSGAVRIMWGPGRSYPSTSVADITPTPTGQVSASGGTVTTSGLYTIQTFTTSGTFTVSSAATGANVEVLVVGGGGSGGNNNTTNANGGGGGGGVIDTIVPVTPGAYTVTVGNGGAAVPSVTIGVGNNGQSSVFGTYTALGGGGGASTGSATAAGSGGSGGGAAQGGGAAGASTQTNGYGNAGGASTVSWTGAGGGGAGGQGISGSSGATGGNGGAGYVSSITGSSVAYAGGGGGSGNSSERAGDGFAGGGRGCGTTSYYSYSSYSAGVNGTTQGSAVPNAIANTGGGGGGCSYWAPNGGWNTGSGTGGSGIVIVRYLTNGGADLAEYYPVLDSSIAAGDIVAFDTSTPVNVTRATEGEANILAGVISTDPGLVLAQPTDTSGQREVALSGRVPTKVSLENGPIAIGDPITISSVPGVGMKAGPLDPSIGNALEAFTASSTGTTIEVFLNLQKGTNASAVGQQLLAQPTATTTDAFDFVGGLIQAITNRFLNGSSASSTQSDASSTPSVSDTISNLFTSFIAQVNVLSTHIDSLLATTSVNDLTTSTSATSTPATPWSGAFAASSGLVRGALASLTDPIVHVFDHALYATTGLFNGVVADTLTASTTTTGTLTAATTTTTALCLGGTCINSFDQLGTTTASSSQPIDLSGFVSTSTFNNALALATSSFFASLPDFTQFVSSSTLSTYITGTQLASALSAIASSSANGTLLAGGTLDGSLVPAGDNLFTLGTATNRFTDVFAKNVNAGDLTFTETNSAVSGAPLVPGDVVSLYVTSTGGTTHTVPINLNTALNSNNWGSNNIYLNTSGSLGLGIASTTAPKAKLDVEGNYASGNSSLLTLANLSGANGNAAIPYSFYIPSNTGDLNIASNDTGTGSLINNSYSAWDFQLGGQSDAFSLKRSAPGTQSYASVFNISNTGNLSIPGNLSIGGTFATGQLQFTNASTSQLSIFQKAYFGATATTTIDAAGNIVGAGTLSAGTSTLSNLIVTNLSTSTFASGISITGGCFQYNGTCLTTPQGTTGQLTYFSGTNTAVGTSTLTLSAAGFFGIGTTSPLATLSIQGTPGSTDIFDLASSTGANVLKVDATGALTAKLKNLTADYVVDSGSAQINVGDIVSYINGKATKVVNTTGTIPSAGTPVALNSTNSTNISAAALDSTHFVTAYNDGSTGYVYSVVSSVSGSTITPGTPVLITSNALNEVSVAALDSTHFVVAYIEATPYYVSAVVSTVSGGTTITPGSAVTVNATYSAGYPISAAALDSTHFVVAYQNSVTTFANAVASSVSGTTITAGTPIALNAVPSDYESVAALDSTHFVVGYRNSSTTFANAVASSVSGTTITVGTPIVLNAVLSNYDSAAKLDSTHFVVAYGDGTNGGDAAVVSTVSGTTITAGTPTALNSIGTSNVSVAALDSTHFAVAYKNISSSNFIGAVVSSVSGTTITASTPVILNGVGSLYTSVAAFDSTHFAVAYQNVTNAPFAATAVVGTLPLVTSPNILGMATNATTTTNNTVTVASNGIVTGLSGLTGEVRTTSAQLASLLPYSPTKSASPSPPLRCFSTRAMGE